MSKTKYIDPQGNEVPAKYVQPYDKLRDRIALRVLARWEKAEDMLRKVKRETLEDIASLQAAAAKTTGVSLGGKQGNMQFRSFNGAITIALDNQARTEFDERLSMAQSLIMEAVKEMSKDASNADLVEIATRAFQPRSSGRLDMQRIRDLRTYKVKNAKWRKACEIIADCERKIGSRQYVRVFRRRDAAIKPEPILLDLAVLDAYPETKETK